MSILRTMLVALSVPLSAWSCVAPKTAFADGSQHWTVSFKEAKNMATEQDKDIFMFFTGSDWSPFDMKLYKNVFLKDVFLKESTKNFILLKLDFPFDMSKQTEEEIAQCKRLRAKYKLKRFPTVILADAKGKPYGKMSGYGGATAEAYTTQLAEQSAVRKQRDDFLAQAEAAKGVDKARLLDRVINLLFHSLTDTELILEFYSDKVEEILKLDANDEEKLKSKYECKLRLAQLQRRLEEIRRTPARNTEGALKEIDAMVDELQPEGQVLQEVLFIKAKLLSYRDKDGCKEALNAALELAPETAVGRRIGQILTNFK